MRDAPRYIDSIPPQFRAAGRGRRQAAPRSRARIATGGANRAARKPRRPPASSSVRRGPFFSIDPAALPAGHAPGGASPPPMPSGRRGRRPPRNATNSGGPSRCAIPSGVMNGLPGLPQAAGGGAAARRINAALRHVSLPGTAGRRDPPALIHGAVQDVMRPSCAALPRH